MAGLSKTVGKNVENGAISYVQKVQLSRTLQRDLLIDLLSSFSKVNKRLNDLPSEKDLRSLISSFNEWMKYRQRRLNFWLSSDCLCYRLKNNGQLVSSYKKSHNLISKEHVGLEMFISVHAFVESHKLLARLNKLFESINNSLGVPHASALTVDQYTDFSMLSRAVASYLDSRWNTLEAEMKSFNAIAADKKQLRFLVLFRFSKTLPSKTFRGPGKPVFCYIAWNRGGSNRRVEPIKNLALKISSKRGKTSGERLKKRSPSEFRITPPMIKFCRLSTYETLIKQQQEKVLLAWEPIEQFILHLEELNSLIVKYSKELK